MEQGTINRLPPFSGNSADYPEWIANVKLDFRISSHGYLLTNVRTISSYTDITQKMYGSDVTTTAKTQFEAYTSLIDRTVASLLRSLDKLSKETVQHLESPLAIITALDNMHIKKDQLSKIYYIRQLVNTPQDDSPDPAHHIAVWRKLMNDARSHGLSDTEIKFDDVMLMLFMLSLHPSNDAIVMHLENLAVTPDMNKICDALSANYRRKEQNSNNALLITQKGQASNSHTPQSQERPPQSPRQQINWKEKEACTKCLMKHFDDCPKKCKSCGSRHTGLKCPQYPCKSCALVHWGSCASHRLTLSSKEIACTAAVVCSAAEQNPTDTEFAQHYHTWILDTGATIHCCKDKRLLSETCPDYSFITGVGGVPIQTELKGESHVELKSGKLLCFYNTIFMPSGNYNIISVSCLAKKGMDTHFTGSNATITDRATGEKIFDCILEDGLYKTFAKAVPHLSQVHQSLVSTNEVKMTATLAHQRLGHLGMFHLRRLMKLGLVELTPEDEIFCHPCALGKSTRNSYDSSKTTVSNIGDLIVSDLKFYPDQTHDGFTCFITFMDVFSGYSSVKLLKRKSDAFEAFKNYHNWFKNQFGYSIKIFRTDNGGEYMSTAFRQYLLDLGIEGQTTVPYNPHQNGIAERLNRTLDEKMMTWMSESNIPRFLWGELIMTANYLRNRLPYARIKNEIPFTLWNKGEAPNYDHLRKIGSDVYCHIPTELRKGLDPKARTGKLMGYALSQKGYRVWDIENQKMVVATNVTFNETNPTFEFIPSEDSETDSHEDEFQITAPIFHPTPAVFHPIPTAHTYAHPPPAPPASPVPAPASPTRALASPARAPASPTSPARAPASPIHAPNAQPAPIALPTPPPRINAEPFMDDPPLIAPAPAPILAPAPAPVLAPVPAPRPAVVKRIKFNLPVPEDSDEDDEPIVQPRISNRVRAKTVLHNVSAKPRPAWGANKKVLQFQENAHHSMLVCDAPSPATIQLADPDNYRESQASDNATEWTQACIEEIEGLKQMNVFDLVERPGKGRKVVKGRWVFRTKENEKGEVIRYKARFTAKGYTQRFGFDYTTTYSPVMKAKSMKLLLSIANTNGWEVVQHDFVRAFLNSDVDTEIYIEQPEGFHDLDFPNHVWKLKKSLYGLKQSGKLWNADADSKLKTLGFTPYESDPCIYEFKDQDTHLLLGLYVDDTLSTGNNDPLRDQILDDLGLEYELKSLGKVKKCIGIEINMNSDTKQLAMSQSQYIGETLIKYGLDQLEISGLPMEPGCHLSKNSSPSPDSEEARVMKTLPYRELTGCFSYIATNTRPDISYAIGEIARHVSNPGYAHWNALLKLGQYLKGTQHYALHFDGTKGLDHQIIGYSDADWGTDLDTRRSKTGFVIYANGGVISWRSKLQASVSLSTLQAEHTAIVETGREVMWTRNILQEMGFEQSPTVIFDDNKACIDTLLNPIVNDRMKHIELKQHWLKHELANQTFEIRYCKSANNTADILTKALGKNLFNIHRESLGVRRMDKFIGVRA